MLQPKNTDLLNGYKNKTHIGIPWTVALQALLSMKFSRQNTGVVAISFFFLRPIGKIIFSGKKIFLTC